MSFGTIKNNLVDTTSNASAGVNDTKASRQNIVNKANAILNSLLATMGSTYNSANDFSSYAVHLKALAFESARIIATSENVYNDAIFTTTRPEFFYQNIETFLFVNQAFPFVNQSDVAIRSFLLSILKAWFNGARKSSIQTALSLAVQGQATFQLTENYLQQYVSPNVDWVPLQHTFTALITPNNSSINLTQLQNGASFLIDLIKPAHTYLEVQFLFNEDNEEIGGTPANPIGFTKGPPCVYIPNLSPAPVPQALINVWGATDAALIWSALGETTTVTGGPGEVFWALPPHQPGQICDAFHIDVVEYQYEDFRQDCGSMLNVPVENETPEILSSTTIKTRYGPLGDGLGNLVSNVNQVQVFINNVQVTVIAVNALKGIITLAAPIPHGATVTVNYSFLRRHFEFMQTPGFGPQIPTYLLNEFDNYTDSIPTFGFSTVLWAPSLTNETPTPLQCSYQYQGFDALDSSLLNDPTTLVFNKVDARDKLNDAWNLIPNLYFIGDTEAGSNIITNVSPTDSFVVGSLISNVNLNAVRGTQAFLTADISSGTTISDILFNTNAISSINTNTLINPNTTPSLPFYDGSNLANPANNVFIFSAGTLAVSVTFPASGSGVITSLKEIVILINSAISSASPVATVYAKLVGTDIQLTSTVQNLVIGNGSANVTLGFNAPTFTNSLVISQPATVTKTGSQRLQLNQSLSVPGVSSTTVLNYPTPPFQLSQEQSLVFPNPNLDIFYLNDLNSTLNNILVDLFGPSTADKLTGGNVETIAKVYAGLQFTVECTGNQIDLLKPVCESGLDFIFDFENSGDTYPGIKPELPDDFLILDKEGYLTNDQPLFYPTFGPPPYVDGTDQTQTSFQDYQYSFMVLNLHDYESDTVEQIEETDGGITAIEWLELDFCAISNAYLHLNIQNGVPPIPGFPPSDHTEDLNNLTYPMFPPEINFGCLQDTFTMDYDMGTNHDVFRKFHKFLLNNDSSALNTHPTMMAGLKTNHTSCGVIGVHPMTPDCGNGVPVSEWLRVFDLEYPPYMDGFGPDFPENPPEPFVDSTFTYVWVESDFSVSGFFNEVDAIGFDVEAMDQANLVVDDATWAFGVRYSEEFTQDVVLFPFFIAHFATASDRWLGTNILMGAAGGYSTVTGWIGSSGTGDYNETVPLPVETSYDILLM